MGLERTLRRDSSTSWPRRPRNGPRKNRAATSLRMTELAGFADATEDAGLKPGGYITVALTGGDCSRRPLGRRCRRYDHAGRKPSATKSKSEAPPSKSEGGAPGAGRTGSGGKRCWPHGPWRETKSC